jgi:hypothetical protein
MINVDDKRVLSNGAIELQRKPTDDENVDIVLALNENQFVVWIHRKDKGIYTHGEYYGNDLRSALKSFEES